MTQRRFGSIYAVALLYSTHMHIVVDRQTETRFWHSLNNNFLANRAFRFSNTYNTSLQYIKIERAVFRVLVRYFLGIFCFIRKIRTLFCLVNSLKIQQSRLLLC